jgi:putative membrane protein
VLLPVAPREVAEAVVERVLPGLGSRELAWVSAPERVRVRAPVQWRALAVAADERVFAVRGGRLVRRWAMVPHARTQSVHLTQGPWQRRLGVATVSVDVADGPVAVDGLHQDAAVARRMADEQAERAKLAIATAGPERWMTHRLADLPAPDPGNPVV